MSTWIREAGEERRNGMLVPGARANLGDQMDTNEGRRRVEEARDCSGDLLVRYQFDRGARLELHFQTIDGRAFFFCPKRVPRSQGERVNVEFTTGAGQNACTLRGVVRGHEMGGTFTGSWIEFAASDLAGTLRKASAAPPSTVLLPINAMVRLRRAGATQVLCRIDAVSETEVH